uniref:F-box DNA helicase 1 n=1 Tax=Sphenodon punctatus TaxID=8508 RepID=A0A8D0G9I0_SPHPU
MAVKQFKRKHLSAGDCEALSQTREGLSSLTQPLLPRQTSRDVNSGLYPRHRTKKPQRGTEIFPAGRGPRGNMSRSHEVKDEDFADGEFFDEEEACSFLEGEVDTVPDPRPPAASRKRPRFSKGAGRCGEQGRVGKQPFLESLPRCPLELGETEPEIEDVEIDPIPDACFGLLGIPSWQEPQGHIDQIPNELLREIFALLPISDLYQDLSLVCHRWRDIIHDPQFIPWKKLYHQYLMKESQARGTVLGTLHRYGITKDEDRCVLGFVRRVCFPQMVMDPEAVLECLKSHHLFAKAKICIAKSLPELQSPAGTANVWAVMAAIVLFSGGVDDIQKLIACLRRTTSTFSLLVVTELLYHMATLLHAMRETGIHISNRIHYNIFYSLYLLENSNHCTAMINAEIKYPGIKLTHEQQRILNHEIVPGQVMKIMAFAGTGKTLTLIKYSEKWSRLKFLYVAFNKSIVQQAKQVFPTNVTCKTFHGLAYEGVGKDYRKNGNLHNGKVTSYAVSFVLQNCPGQSRFIRAKTVVKTLEAFVASADESISVEHTPIWCRNTKGEQVLVAAEEKRIIVEEAQRIWDTMKTLNRSKQAPYKITHDGYLKLWQLKKPSLSKYDAVFVDEAQDCTPAIMDIVLSQTCGVILVGDPHQQIYSFRGAVNALFEVPHTHIFYLTKVRLERKGERTFTENENSGLEKILDIWKLLQPRDVKLEIKNPFIRKWVEKGGYAGLRDYVKKSEDMELEIKMAIVEKYKIQIPELVKRISDCHVMNHDLDYVLSTVHKAKGLEFDTVQIGDDFPKIPAARHNLPRLPDFSLEMIPEDDWNLLYVAVTRAKRRLVIPKFLSYLLTLAGEYFLQPELTSEVLKEGVAWCSVPQCFNTVPAESILTMKKTPFTYSNGTKDRDGHLCHACVLKRLGPVTWLTISPHLMQEMEDTNEPLELPHNVAILFHLF